MDAIIWIHDPYPFWPYQQRSLELALHKAYRSERIYYRHERRIDYMEINGTTLTICRSIAQTIEAIHRHHVYVARMNLNSNVYALDFFVEIREASLGRPD